MEFSVVIPSRNRPQLLRQAIESILMQSCDDYEVLVVNDGSDGENRALYQAMATEMAPKVRFIDLEYTPQGHGSSYAINMGVAQARGRYVTFLDDDDFWTDPGHLERTRISLQNDEGGPVDVIYAEQAGYRGGQRVDQVLWLNGLLDQPAVQRRPAAGGAFALEVDELMQREAFAHFNTTVVRRALFDQIGGLDNNIRYENDRDFYLRTIDAANRILFQPVEISQHNIPDQARADNLSTVVNELQKLLYQVQVFDKALLFCRHPAIRRYGRRSKGFALKSMALRLAGQGQFATASAYARQALGVGFSVKWMGVTCWLALRALINHSPTEGPERQ